MTSHIRLAARALLRTPGFTIGAILPLALGFALTAATVAVLNTYLIRPLPYPFANRVYHVRYAPPGPWEPRGLSGLDWKSLSDVVEFPMASAADAFYVSGGGTAPSLRGRRVTFGLVEGQTTPMAAGRWLIESDFQGADEPAALIGFNVWRDRFGSDPGVIGRPLATETENGRSERFRIAGVLPRDFHVGGDSQQPIEMIVPFDASARRYYMVRLRPGVPPGVAERRMTEAARQIATDLPSDWTGVQLELAHDRYAGEFRPVLLGVTAAASLLLVSVFANVAVLIVDSERPLRFLLRADGSSARGAFNGPPGRGDGHRPALRCRDPGRHVRVDGRGECRGDLVAGSSRIAEESGSVAQRGVIGPITRLAVSPDGKWIAIVSTP